MGHVVGPFRLAHSVLDRSAKNTNCGMCPGPFEFDGRQWVGYVNFLFHFCLLMFSLAHHLHCSGLQHSIQSIKFSAIFFFNLAYIFVPKIFSHIF